MQQVFDVIITNWPYVLFAIFFAIFCFSIVVYQTKDMIIRKREVKRDIEKSKNFKKYNITEIDVDTLDEKNHY